jgi:hypothetical protein
VSEYVSTRDLPAPVQAALKAVGHGRDRIEVIPAESVTLGSSAGDGRRAFVVLVDLSTGEHRTVWGSWGGPNMFNRSNPVDNDHGAYALPGHGVAITGSAGGGGPVWAQLHVPASMVARILPGAPREELSQVERDALYCHRSIKGGAYRRDELRRRRVPSSTVDALVERGLLKRNRAGATAITTAGLNAVNGYNG